MIKTRSRSLVIGLILAFVLIPLAWPVKADTEQTWTGTLTAMSGTTLPATLTLQVGTTAYTVTVTADTEAVRKFNGESSLVEFAIGDILKVEGTLTGTTITATEIKDWSIQRKGGSFWGNVKSVDATASSFVITPTSPKKLSDQTVTTNSKTKIFQGNREGTFADLAVGMKVKVIGLWRKSSNTVVADRVLIQLTEINGTIKAVDTTVTPNTVTVTSVKSESRRVGKVLAFKKTSADYVVSVTSSTVLRGKEMVILSINDLKVGDRVQVKGLSTGDLTMTALQIFDKSAKKKNSSYEGTIDSINSEDKTFTLEKEHGNKKSATTITYDVATTAETIYVDQDGKAIDFADLEVGHEVQIRGSLTGTTLTANLVIDKDLPQEGD